MSASPDNTISPPSNALPIALHPNYIEFANAYLKTDDVTKAYLATHPECNSARRAKTDGRRILNRADVQAYLQYNRLQALDSSSGSGQDAARIAWENEVRSIAFARVNLKKVPVKEKNAALRIYGETKGYLKAPSQAGTGIKATFNFRVSSDGAAGSKSGAVAGDRMISVDVDTTGGEIGAPEPFPASRVFDVRPDPERSELRSNPTMPVGSEATEGLNPSPSPSPSPCAEDRHMTDSRGQPHADDRQSVQQHTDSEGNTPQTTGIPAHATVSTEARKRPTARSGAPLSVDKSAPATKQGKRPMFDSTNS